jgi:MoxR-like ATPase
MKELSPGYVFETVFWIAKGEDGVMELIAQTVNGKPVGKRIVAADRRAIPGQCCKVQVVEAEGDIIRVNYLGLADFTLQKDIYIEPGLLKQFEILLCSGRSIMLDGPQGTGKTTISKALSESLGMVYVFFNCSVCFEPADFVGSLQLIMDENGNARTEWVKTEVLAAVQDACEHPEKRYLIFLDELNRCRSYALNGIMSAIDASRRIFDPARNCYIAIPENVQWIAAINNGRQFHGTYKIDVAQLDRFAVLKLDYPPVDNEISILAQRYGMVKQKSIRKVVETANAIRNDEGILTDLSMRATDEACMFLSYPTFQKSVSDEDFINVLRTCFCNRLPGNVEDEGSEAQVASVIIERQIRLGDLIGKSDTGVHV